MAGTRASSRIAAGVPKRSLSPSSSAPALRAAPRKRVKVTPRARGHNASATAAASASASAAYDPATYEYGGGAAASAAAAAAAVQAAAIAADDVNTVRFVLRRHPHEVSVGRLQREYLRTSTELNVYHMKKFLGKKLSHKQFREFEVRHSSLPPPPSSW